MGHRSTSTQFRIPWSLFSHYSLHTGTRDKPLASSRCCVLLLLYWWQHLPRPSVSPPVPWRHQSVRLWALLRDDTRSLSLVPQCRSRTINVPRATWAPPKLPIKTTKPFSPGASFLRCLQTLLQYRSRILLQQGLCLWHWSRRVASRTYRCCNTMNCLHVRRWTAAEIMS